MNSQTKLAVVVCSVGRPDCVSEIVDHLKRQTRLADRIVVAVTRPEDVGATGQDAHGLGTDVEVIFCKKGLPRQRNAALDALGQGADIVVFFDDDFVPSRYALAGIEAAFARWPDVNGMTGALLADGINGAGYDASEATAMAAHYDEAGPPLEPNILKSGLAGLYGCNMAYRLSAVGKTRFDPALPLYGWQEDIDFAAQIPGGRIKTDAFCGVHRGAKSGRETAGRRLGYSQLANTWYLVRKGTMQPRFALRLSLRNLLANHLKIFRPEPWIDRRARAAGNWLALWDILRGKAHPERILDL